MPFLHAWSKTSVSGAESRPISCQWHASYPASMSMLTKRHEIFISSNSRTTSSLPLCFIFFGFVVVQWGIKAVLACAGHNHGRHLNRHLANKGNQPAIRRAACQNSKPRRPCRTVTRRPRMHGFPPIMAGFTVMRFSD